ncbi:MAG: hypothetical protein ACR2RE_18150 [Geminicoccaceae bacterium]
MIPSKPQLTALQAKNDDVGQIWLTKKQRIFVHLLAEKSIRSGRINEAITLLEAALALHDDDSNLWKIYSYASLLSRSGKVTLAAVEKYRTLSGDFASKSPITLIESRALAQTGRWQEARELARRFINEGAGRSDALQPTRSEQK